MKAEPTEIKWCPSKDPAKKVIAAVLGGKQIMILDTPTQKNYMVNFNPQAGKVVTYHWYGEDHLIVGFTTGLVQMISVHPDTLG